MKIITRGLRFLGLIVGANFLSGCVTQPEPYYYWGQYEQVVREIYVAPGNADPLQQIEKLSKDLQEAQNNGKPVPPGVYAHLGFVYSIQGEINSSITAFEKEKQLYPESTVFIDGMMQRAFGKKTKDDDNES